MKTCALTDFSLYFRRTQQETVHIISMVSNQNEDGIHTSLNNDDGDSAVVNIPV